MHEIALATQLAEVAQRYATGRTVNRIHLRIGALRQVVPETLSYAWDFVAHQPPLSGSTLEIDWLPVVLKCPNGHHAELDATDYFSQLCPECGLYADVLQGEEFTVVAIEVEKEK